MIQVKTIFTAGFFWPALAVGPLLATPQTDLLLGHFEPHIDYQLTPGDPDAGWQFSISYDVSGDFTNPEGVVRLDPATTTIVATPETETVLSSPIQGLAGAGDTIWLLPQSNQAGKIFLGWRTIIPAGVFQQSSNGFFQPSTIGNIIVELTDLAGPGAAAGGHFAMWEVNGVGTVEMHFNSSDGFNSNDRLEPVPIGTHTHYNWGLTQPGNYTATFRASGRLNLWQPDGGQDTSGSFDLHFAVPFSSVATGEAELRLSLSADTPAAVHPYGETVEYEPGQVALVTREILISGSSHPYAFGLDPVANTSTVAPHRVGIPGDAPIAFPTGTSLDATPLEVVHVKGPGTLQILPEATRHYFLFSEPGIYRVGLRAWGTDNSGPVPGPAFELVFLAGLEADYDFAAWADSFERSHGIAPGTFSEDGSDYDGDGVPDLVEYQLFWEGFDPAVPDAHKLPRPDPNLPEGLITFYRDTYKDRLNRNTQNIVLEYSADLSAWLGWSDRVPAQPLEQYETGAERGNAYGRIQRRCLRLAGDERPENAFFRWRIDPAQ
ncbi:MAG: choice-of-anchor M domain-containing protein [Opitutales bacterium]